MPGVPGIEQPDRFELELCGESLALDYATPPGGLSPFKGVRQIRASSEPTFQRGNARVF
jgi:hypothetical protein